MGSIYSQAKEVLVWLGEADDDTCLALQVISQVSTLRNKFDEQSRAIILRMQSTNAEKEVLMESLRKRIGLDWKDVYGVPSWAAYYRFLERPWFSRLWVSMAFCSGILADC